MKNKINIEKIKSALAPRNAWRLFLAFLFKQSKVLIFLIFIAASAYLVHIWYNFLYKSEWSNEKKQEYIKNKERGIIFNRKNFESIIEDFKIRKEEYQKNLENIEDIFRLKM